MKFDTVTIKDIAKELNLSTSTVSRALRGSHEISAETKKLVLEYAEKINYRPNPIALSLKERRSRTIGVVVSEIANNFFSEAINGIESIAYNRGYHVIITQSHESAAREKVNVEHHVSRSVDGLLISLSSETIDELVNQKVKPDAVFTASDRITTLCFGIVRKMKLKKELGFAGFTNTKVAELFNPPLTAVKQPAFEIGQTATELLIQMIESK